MEVDEVVGPRGRWNRDRIAVRHGHEGGEVTLGGRRVAVKRPRVRTADGESEVTLETYEHFAERAVEADACCAVHARAVDDDLLGRIERSQRVLPGRVVKRARDVLGAICVRRQDHEELEVISSLELCPQLIARYQVHRHGGSELVLAGVVGGCSDRSIAAATRAITAVRRLSARERGDSPPWSVRGDLLSRSRSAARCRSAMCSWARIGLSCVFMAEADHRASGSAWRGR